MTAHQTTDTEDRTDRAPNQGESPPIEHPPLSEIGASTPTEIEWCDTTQITAVVTLGTFTPDGTSYARSWPNHKPNGGCHADSAHGPCKPLQRLIRHNLRRLLDERYHHPAYLLSYRPPLIPYRLSHGVLSEPGKLAEAGGSIDLHLALYDVDRHGADAGDVDKWFDAERPKIRALQERHGCLVYRSRGGYRILGIRKTPFAIKGLGNVLDWKRLYLAEVNYLAHAFGIGLDTGDGGKLDQLVDWQRLQRVPHDLRSEEGRPEELEIIGDIGRIGYWAPPLEDRDHAWARDQIKTNGIKSKTRPQKQTDAAPYDKPTVLRLLLEGRGLLGVEIEAGHKWSVTCPAVEQHSTPSNGTDTVLYENGGKLGHIHCSHAGCGHSGWTIDDWYRQFDAADVDQAKATVGLGTKAKADEVDRDPAFRIHDKDDWPGIAHVAATHLEPVVLWRGTWYLFDGHRYAEQSERDLKREIRTVCKRMWRMGKPSKDADLQPMPFKTSTITDREVMVALETESDVIQLAEAEPYWVDCDANEKYKRIPLDQWIFFKNTTLDFASGKTFRPSPRLFVSRTLGCKYYSPTDIDELRKQQKADPKLKIPSLECPAFKAFLAVQWGPDSPNGRDDESIMLLQEWMGYCLTRTFEHRKLLFVMGPPGSGKGTLFRLMEALIGDGCGVFQVASLNKDFGLASWRHKDVMLDADARFGKLDADAMSLMVSRLLKLTGGDDTQVEVKYTGDDSIRGVKIMVASNGAFKVVDAYDALIGRLLILQTCVSLEGCEDRTLLGKLLRELPGIVAWALEGLARLRANNQFTVPRYHEVARERIADSGNPTRVFFREELRIGDGLEVSRDEVYAAYSSQAKQNGLGVKSALTLENELSQYMQRHGVTLNKTRRMVKGVRGYWYDGVALWERSTSLTDQQNITAWFAMPTYRDWTDRGVETAWQGQYAHLRDVMEHALGIPRERQPKEEHRVLSALAAAGYEPDDRGRYTIPGRDAGATVRHLHSVPSLSESAFGEAEIEALVNPVIVDYDPAEIIRRYDTPPAGEVFDARAWHAMRKARLEASLAEAHETMCTDPTPEELMLAG